MSKRKKKDNQQLEGKVGATGVKNMNGGQAESHGARGARRRNGCKGWGGKVKCKGGHDKPANHSKLRAGRPCPGDENKIGEP